MSLITFFKGYKKFAIFFSLLCLVIIAIIYSILDRKNPLPIWSPAKVNAKLVDESIQHIEKYHTIADFSLLNQNGDTITQEHYKNKIYVADFFFTTCQSICPVMTDHMYKIQRKTFKDDEVMLLSHSVTPVKDSVPVLKAYAKEKGVLDKKWNLVTGDKKHIYELARKSYLAVEEDGNGDVYDMIHTENFLLIDKKRRIRGYYDGTNPEDIDQLLEDIETLKYFGGY